MDHKISNALNHKVIEELLRKGLENDRRFRLRVSSRSMIPVLEPGDSVFIQRVDPEQLVLGELVVIRRDTDLAIHRLIQIDRQGWFITKGDNLPFSDPPIRAGDILGKAAAIEQKGRVVSLHSRKWKRVNRILAALSRWEVGWIRAGEQGGSPVFSSEGRLEEAGQPGWRIGNGGWGLGVSRWLRLFFRWMRWVVAWLFRGKAPGKDA